MLTSFTDGATDADYVYDAAPGIRRRVRSVVDDTVTYYAFDGLNVLDVMAQAVAWTPEVLRVDGGAVGNDFLMQFVADILGLPVERSAMAETTALGAAGLAGITAGLWRDPEDFLAHLSAERTFTPQMGPQERERLYAQWQDAVSRCRQWA